MLTKCLGRENLSPYLGSRQKVFADKDAGTAVEQRDQSKKLRAMETYKKQTKSLPILLGSVKQQC